MSKPRKVKKKKTTTGTTKKIVEPVRLSQVMIVKNEERNIERALSWAKNIAYEQIVVDTGSSDRTVEIAERMGAKIFHYEWIDDFSAAKNYAIEQATGNWIAFLDADEYFEYEDTNKLMQILEKIDTASEGTKVLALKCDWVQLNDGGEVTAVYEQQRIFRNRPDIRYINRIHEILTIQSLDSISNVRDFKIFHTGYTNVAYEETKKAERNEKILREELKTKPDDLMLKGYLADALSVDRNNAEKMAEAEKLYREIVYSGKPLNEITARNAFDHMINLALETGELENRVETAIELCKRAMGYLENVPDYAYNLGSVLYIMKRYDEAWDAYVKCEKIIEESEVLQNRMTPANLTTMMRNMAHIAIIKEDYASVLNYSSLTLIMDKYTEDTLTALVLFTKITHDRGMSTDFEAIEYLRQFYDFDDPHDKLFLAKCAKRAGDEVLMIYFYKLITDADKAVLAGTPNEPTYESDVVQ